MNAGTYRFTVGAIDCIAASDGELSYAPPDFPPAPPLLFVNARDEEVNERLRLHDIRAEQWTQWTSPYVCLAVNTGGRWLLIDTGAAALAPTTGKLLGNLQDAGIDAGDIDMVVLTHGHPDHIGGLTNADGSLAFPGASYCMCRHEWEFWTCGEAEELLDDHLSSVLIGCARRNLPPIRGRLELVDRTTEIAPGVTVFPSPGHTPGHMALVISSGDEHLMCVGDAVLHPIHVECPEWYSAMDGDPEEMVSTRCRLLGRAVRDGALVHAFHFPFPGLGRISRSGDPWRWEPVSLPTG